MLRRLSRESKWAITLFFVPCVLGPFVNAAYHALRVGVGLTAAAGYYRGTVDLPAKSLLELVETTHFHVWIQTVVVFLAAFLFSLTERLSSSAKIVLVALGFGFSLLHLLAPFVARFGPVFGVALVLAGATGLTLCLWIYAYSVWRELWSRGS